MPHDTLELSDEQREQVREMLAKFSTKKSTQAADAGIAKQGPDPARPRPSGIRSTVGSTVEWHELTPKTRRYTFVRDTRALFVPFILDSIRTSTHEIRQMVEVHRTRPSPRKMTR